MYLQVERRSLVNKYYWGCVMLASPPCIQKLCGREAFDEYKGLPPYQGIVMTNIETPWVSLIPSETPYYS